MDHTENQLFRRCVKCPSTTPSCPPCAADETCTLIASSCNQCASTVCTKIEGATTSDNHPNKAGPIAGGVAAGVAVIALLTFLIWRYVIREKRKAWDQQDSVYNAPDGVEKRDQFGLHREARQSTRSVHSIASTVLTRASNVIQIAYIPGVTNRSPPETPGLLVPPVPPLPLATVNSNATSPAYDHDQHYFLPGNLRDSTWSDYSDMSRMSLAPSLARASVATTVYRNNAIVSPVPAQQALRGKAAMVSVKSPSPSTPTDAELRSPPLPAHAASIASTASSIVARNMVPRPIQVRKSPSGTNVPTLANLKVKANSQQSNDGQSKRDSRSSERSPESDGPSKRTSIGNERSGRRSDTVTVIDDVPEEGVSSSGREHSAGASHRHKKSGSLQSLIEEAMSRAAKEPNHGGLGSIEESHKDAGPFSDANEVRE